MTSSNPVVEQPEVASVEQPAGPAFPVKSVLEALGAIAGASALLSALMLYFGWVRTRALFDYFGVPVEALKFGTTDYVLRSTDVFFRPVIWSTLAFAGLVIIFFAVSSIDQRIVKPPLRVLLRGTLAAIAGGCGVVGAFGLIEAVSPRVAAVSMCVSSVMIVMQYGFYHRVTGLRPPGIVFVIGLVLTIAALFWAVSIYAADMGRSLAQQFAEGALPRPIATVHSKTDLGIPGIPEPAAASQSWPFTYGGYKVLAFANNEWFLIYQQWHIGSPTITVPDSDSVRVVVAGS
jgi:hypothetical protein